MEDLCGRLLAVPPALQPDSPGPLTRELLSGESCAELKCAAVHVQVHVTRARIGRWPT